MFIFWKKLSVIVTAVSVFIGIGILAGCKDLEDMENVSCQADLVVYGKIFTSDNNKIVEAFAVKDGKFVYVGDKSGVSAYIDAEKTRIIDHNGKGMIIPGCYEGHAHFLMKNGMDLMGCPDIGIKTSVSAFKEAVKVTYNKAKAAGRSNIYGFGWLYQSFEQEGMPTRQELDSLCPDVALFISDSEGHKGLANTLCLVNAGIMKADGTVLKKGNDIRGGEICMTDGKPNGLLKEQASTYVRNKGIDFNEIFPASLAADAVSNSQDSLLQNGFVSYMDGWANYYGTDVFYKAARTLDDNGGLHILLGMPYEFESSCESVEAELEAAVDTKKYSGGHVYANYVKLFIDGIVEGGTGLTTQPYQCADYGYGIDNWKEDEVTEITRYANSKDMTMHIHTMGDGAVHRAVNALIAGGRKEARNTVVHTRNVLEEDFQRIADYNIVAVGGILWHAMDDEAAAYLDAIVPVNLVGKAYPMKSYFDHGAIMSSHCDFPATSGSPKDPFGIMEIAVSGQMTSPMSGNITPQFWKEELISREQALQALTINGAYQMHVEKERGSIKVGKYADFVLTDKDVLNCDVSDIHTTKVISTWFEGKMVYESPIRVLR